MSKRRDFRRKKREGSLWGGRASFRLRMKEAAKKTKNGSQRYRNKNGGGKEGGKGGEKGVVDEVSWKATRREHKEPYMLQTVRRRKSLTPICTGGERDNGVKEEKALPLPTWPSRGTDHEAREGEKEESSRGVASAGGEAREDILLV